MPYQVFTSQQLSTIAEGIRTLVSDLGVQSDRLDTACGRAGRHLGTVATDWHCPRATTALTAASTYLDGVSPAAGEIEGARTVLSGLAVDATDIAGFIANHEATISTAEARLDSADPDEVAGAATAIGDARRRIEQLALDWVEVARTASGALSAFMPALEEAHRAFASGFPAVVVTGDAYVTMMLTFAGAEGIALSAIDPTGELARKAEDRIAFMMNTGLGDMYLDEIDEVGTEAATDPAAVRLAIEQWAEDNGVELDDATVAFLTGQITGTAAAMRVSEDEPWNDDEIDASYDPANDATVIALWPGCRPTSATA